MIDKNKMFNVVELFKGKIMPPFLKNHPISLEPQRINKVFKSIGMSNFKEDTNITKCMVDTKKENGYVFNLLADISNQCSTAKRLISLSSQKTQFLAPLEERLAKKNKLNEIAQIATALTFLAENCDPRSPAAFHPTNGIVSSSSGKIDLRLHTDILNGEGKPIHKKGLPIFRLYAQLRDKCIENGVHAANIVQLEALETFKTFGKENIPNKKYQIVFSADGDEGAWDLLTMSVRGTKSCQRWDGEYPKCLIGSVLSRFVGIIYLTSGVSADPYLDYGVLGTKMMRRCIVRYAYDRDTESPCLIMDKMYLAEDREIIKTFMDVLTEKSKLPVYYGPDLAAKTKHIHIPNEISREIKDRKKLYQDAIPYREKSYQDTPLRTKCELDALILTHNQTEMEKTIIQIHNNFSRFIASKFEDIEYGNNSGPVDPDMKKMVASFKLSGPFTLVGETIFSALFAGFIPPCTMEHFSIRSFKMAYLKSMLKMRESLINGNKAKIDLVVKTHSSRVYSIDNFTKYLIQIMLDFAKKELKDLIINR